MSAPSVDLEPTAYWRSAGSKVALVLLMVVSLR